VTHLGKRISALVDGQLGHDARDRALAHIAHCAACRAGLDEERAIKERLAAAGPAPSPELLAGLLALAERGEPLPPRERPMPLAPIVPTLPPPGRRRRSGAPRTRSDPSRPGRVPTRRVRYVAAGALSVTALVLGTAFAAGGPQAGGTPVVPPAAELKVEHAVTSSGLPLHDPGFAAVTATFGGLTVPGPPAR